MKKNGANVLDLRGTILPVAMLECIRAFNLMKPDGILEILVGDSETREDLFKVLQASSYSLVEMVEKNSLSRIRLKKKEEGRRQDGLFSGASKSNNLKEEEK